MKNLLNELWTSLVATVCLGLLVCGLYPLLVWTLAQTIFTHQANGSIVETEGSALGSSLIGQPFSGPKYFQPRPSAAGHGYDAANSGATNLGPVSKRLIDDIAARISRYREINSLGPNAPVPADAVTASASGLDPHISAKNALIQAPRVARARGISLEDVKRTVEICTQARQFGIFGEPRVNVLLLNLALDGNLWKP